MAFATIIGQKRVRVFLQKAMAHGRISHAYLFTGVKGVGKEAVALDFAKALLCSNKFACSNDPCPDCTRVAKLNHPDVHFIFPAPAKVKQDDRNRVLASVAANPYHRLEIWSNPMISIDQIREIRRTSSYKSFEGKGRVVVIVDCERMTIEASNALLKILEEPPDKTHLIMISSRPNLLLPTITSRCQEVKFNPLTFEEIEQALVGKSLADKRRARITARMSAGSYARAMELLDENLQELQETALDFFRKTIQNQFIQIQFVEQLINSYHRDLQRIKELLKAVAIWFRDAMIFVETNGANPDFLIHSEQTEILKNFTNHFPKADLSGAIVEIERALELMDRNVQINLILVVLLSRLRRHLRR